MKVLSKKYTIIIYLILLNLLLINCKDKDWRDEISSSNKEINTQLILDQSKLKQMVKKDYLISNSSNSKEEAIQSYLIELLSSNKKQSDMYSFDKKELSEILYPNSLGTGTSLDSTPLSIYEDLVWQRKILGEEKILNKFKNKNFSIKKINWRKGFREYGVLKGYKPDSIEIISNRELIIIEEIKQVIEHNGQYKVAIVAP